ALARIALSLTARRSTCVISDGTPMTTRGRSQPLRLCALRMKWVSIFSAASKSAMTPSFIGLMAVMLPGVRPSISFASVPTASMRPFTLLSATIDGSLRTMPLPRAYTHVLAVPRSMARSWQKRDSRESNTEENSFTAGDAGTVQPRTTTAPDGNSDADFVIVSTRGNWFKKLRLLKTDTAADYDHVDELQLCRSPFCERAWK